MKKSNAGLVILSAFMISHGALAAEPRSVDSLAGMWKTIKGGAVVSIKKDAKGQFRIEGKDSVSSWSANCNRESRGISCAGAGKMLADGEPFIYRTNIDIQGSRVLENWRVNNVSAPDSAPVNAGNDELVQEAS